MVFVYGNDIEQSKASDYPVWLPYAIPDIGPYFRALPIQARGWAPLHYLRGQGRYFLINRIEDGERNVVYDTTSIGEGWILYTPYYQDARGKISFSQLNFNDFNTDIMNEFRYAFWFAEDTGDPLYNRIKNKTSNKNVYYRFASCDPSSVVYTEWHPVLDSWLGFRASQYDTRIAFFEDNGHTPYYYAGLMCANGRSVYDPNKHQVHRVVAAGAERITPYRYYPLNSDTAACDFLKKTECGVTSGVEYVPDRFGESKGAMSFDASGADIGYAVLPFTVFSQMQKKGAFTVSFWFKKTPKEIEGNATDYYPSVKERWSQMMWATSDKNGADIGITLHDLNTITGAGSSGHVSFARRTTINNHDFFWQQWLEEPARLSWQNNPDAELSPWTLVVAVFSQNTLSIYMFNEKMFLSGPVKDRSALLRYTFLKITPQQLAQIKQWGIGKLPKVDIQVNIAIEAMDDMVVFDSALSEVQVRDLLNAQIVGHVQEFYTGSESQLR